MSESGMRSKVTKTLRSLDAIAVENPARPGTPDVNYVEGWIELKWLRKWPVREDSIVQVKHFTAQQRVFHLNRRRKGGRSWVLIQCRREWILLTGEVAALILGQCTKQELYDNAHQRWTSGINQKELIECISKDMSVYSFPDADKEKLKLLLRKGTTSPETDT